MPSSEKKPFFSIIIPTLNEEKYLPRLLADLGKQTCAKGLFEVIHVDGNSDDQTVQVADSYKQKIPITTWVVKTRNVSLQRNVGAAKAHADWLIFMDADNLLPAQFIDGIKYQLAKKPTTDIFSCWMDESAYSQIDRPLAVMANLAMEIYAKLTPLMPGAMIGVRKKIHQQHPFDESLFMSEDHEYVKTIVNTGHKLQIFREPKYCYSFRRLKSDGSLKVARAYAKAQLNLILGRKIKNAIADYPMLGGSYYEGRSHNYFSRLHIKFQGLIPTDRQRARELLRLNKIEKLIKLK